MDKAVERGAATRFVDRIFGEREQPFLPVSLRLERESVVEGALDLGATGIGLSNGHACSPLLARSDVR